MRNNYFLITETGNEIKNEKEEQNEENTKAAETVETAETETNKSMTDGKEKNDSDNDYENVLDEDLLLSNLIDDVDRTVDDLDEDILLADIDDGCIINPADKLATTNKLAETEVGIVICENVVENGICSENVASEAGMVDNAILHDRCEPSSLVSDKLSTDATEVEIEDVLSGNVNVMDTDDGDDDKKCKSTNLEATFDDDPVNDLAVNPIESINEQSTVDNCTEDVVVKKTAETLANKNVDDAAVNTADAAELSNGSPPNNMNEEIEITKSSNNDNDIQSNEEAMDDTRDDKFNDIQSNEEALDDKLNSDLSITASVNVNATESIEEGTKEQLLDTPTEPIVVENEMPLTELITAKNELSTESITNAPNESTNVDLIVDNIGETVKSVELITHNNLVVENESITLIEQQPSNDDKECTESAQTNLIDTIVSTDSTESAKTDLTADMPNDDKDCTESVQKNLIDTIESTDSTESAKTDVTADAVTTETSITETSECKDKPMDNDKDNNLLEEMMESPPASPTSDGASSSQGGDEDMLMQEDASCSKDGHDDDEEEEEEDASNSCDISVIGVATTSTMESPIDNEIEPSSSSSSSNATENVDFVGESLTTASGSKHKNESIDDAEEPVAKRKCIDDGKENIAASIINNGHANDDAEMNNCSDSVNKNVDVADENVIREESAAVTINDEKELKTGTKRPPSSPIEFDAAVDAVKKNKIDNELQKPLDVNKDDETIDDKTKITESEAAVLVISEMQDVTVAEKRENVVVAASATVVEVKPTVVHHPKPELKLMPAPKDIQPTRSLSLDFIRKFKKNFDQMTRTDMEELVLQKVVEATVHKSELADLRAKCDYQENVIASFRLKIGEITKQFRDLDMVHSRVIKDMEVRNQNIITPVKITRAVGLQVSLPRKESTGGSAAAAAHPSTSSTASSTSPANKQPTNKGVAPSPVKSSAQQQSIASTTTTPPTASINIAVAAAAKAKQYRQLAPKTQTNFTIMQQQIAQEEKRKQMMQQQMILKQQTQTQLLQQQQTQRVQQKQAFLEQKRLQIVEQQRQMKEMKKQLTVPRVPIVPSAQRKSLPSNQIITPVT